MTKKLGKRGVLEQLGGLIQTLGFLAILIAVVFLVVAQIAANDQVAADENASRAVMTVQTSMGDIPEWLPVIVITVIGGILLGLIQFFRRSG